MEEEFEKRLKDALDFEWCEEGGFFFDFRFGKFNEDAYVRTRNLIIAIDFSGEEKISKQLVARIYDIPAFLQGNKEHVLRKGGSKMLYEMAYGEFTCLLSEKFSEKPRGLPFKIENDQ